MEKAERGLLQALRRGLPEIVRMNIAVDVAEGLKAIHDVNYAYKDLKPGNVLVSVLMTNPIYSLVKTELLSIKGNATKLKPNF